MAQDMLHFFNLSFNGNLGNKNTRGVSKESSLTFSAVYSCVRLISESIASLPIKVYRIEEDQDKITDVSHPIYKLIAQNPNKLMTTYTFLDVLMSYPPQGLQFYH